MISCNLSDTATLWVLLMSIMSYTYASEQTWPDECKSRTYCHIQPDYYPRETFAKLLAGVKFNYVQGGGVSNRSSEDDVAHCPKINVFEKVYLILDDNEKIRFVAQNEDFFTFKLEIEECSQPGRIYPSVLDENQLQTHQVDCYETRKPFKFPVLSLDGTKLESVAPKDGISLSCSAKVMKT